MSRDLLLQVREARRQADAAELQILELALEYAAANPALPGVESWRPVEAPSWLEDSSDELSEEDREWIGLPSLRWPPSSPVAGHRPDRPRPARGRGMLRLHAERRELEQLEALDRRHVTIDAASINHTGIWQMAAGADWADLAPFDETLTAVAEALVHQAEHASDTLDVRRSLALGILADPTRAKALLEGDLDAAPTRLRELVTTVHLTEVNLLGLDPVARDADQRACLDQVVRGWAGRHDIALTVRPIQHCGGCAECPAEIDCTNHPQRMRSTYAPSARDLETVRRRDHGCAHPHCNRSARRCDCDHITAFDDGGLTCPRCNLAPLCRHHHRLKTFAGWRYWMLGPPGAYLWRDPHGLLYVRTRDGTRSLD